MTSNQTSALFFCLLSLLITIGPANAQKKYELEAKTEIRIAAGSAILLGTAGLIENSRVPITAAEIALLNPSSINTFDRSAIFKNNHLSSQRSDLFRDVAFAAPLLLFVGKDGRNHWKEIGVLYLETALVNTALTSFTKTVTHRNRPYLYNPDIPIEERTGGSSQRSFYSGHVSHVASLSFFTAKAFADLYPNSKYRKLVWVISAAVPAYTAFLRYDGGHHFPTDVIVGYIAGAAVGILIPKLHHIKLPKNMKVRLSPTISSGLNLAVSLKL